ncbi:MAG: hypothetical protein ACOYL3_26850 [Desulfuromonadaceae bacterium]
MNRHVRSALVMIVTIIALLTASLSHARLPSPPPQLTGIFMDFSLFEAAFKNDRWDEAQAATGRINDKFIQMLPQLKREIKGNPEKTFQTIKDSLNRSVLKHDKEKTQKLFIDLHTFTLSLIRNYEYKIPPVFIIINKYIAEAEEALENKRYDRVMSEVEEITSLFSFAENHFDNREIRRMQIDDIRLKLQEIKSSAQNKKSDSVKSGIISFKRMLSELLRL